MPLVLYHNGITGLQVFLFFFNFGSDWWWKKTIYYYLQYSHHLVHDLFTFLFQVIHYMRKFSQTLSAQLLYCILIIHVHLVLWISFKIFADFNFVKTHHHGKLSCLIIWKLLNKPTLIACE